MTLSHDWSRISLKGPDASDFLHRLSTVNVKQMKPGDGRPGFFLTPQGKVRAYFWLWLLNPGEFVFEFAPGQDGLWKKNLLSFIEQFHFAEKFELTESDLKAQWIFPESPQGAPLRAETSADGVTLLHHGSSDFGRPWITVWEQTDKFASGQNSLDPATIERLRISSTRPWNDSEITENTNPLEVGLPEAISSNKGCYPGQEVIEKIISLGAPAKRLVKIEGAGAKPLIGAVLTAQDSEAGQITSIISTDQGFTALAIVKKVFAKDGQTLSVAGQSATITHVAPYTD